MEIRTIVRHKRTWYSARDIVESFGLNPKEASKCHAILRAASDGCKVGTMCRFPYGGRGQKEWAVDFVGKEELEGLLRRRLNIKQS